MDFKKPLIAAVVAVLLMGIYAWDRERAQDTRLDNIRSGRLIPFDVVDATRLELINESGEYILEKDNSETWNLIEPISWPADGAQVKALIDNLHGAKLMETFETSNLDTYGLANPVAQLSVTGNLNGETVTQEVLIGKDAGELSRVYVKHGDTANVVHTTGNWVRNQALKDLRLLRKSNLLSFDRKLVDSVRIEKESGVLEFEKTEESSTGWLINDSVPVSRDRFDRFLNTMENLQASDILDDPTTPVATLGLDPAFVTISFQGDGIDQTLRIGKKLPNAFWTTSSYIEKQTDGVVVAKTRDRFLTEVFYTQTDWQTQKLLWLPVDQYTAIRGESTSGVTRLFRDIEEENSEWLFESFEGVPVRQELVGMLLGIVDNIGSYQLEGRDFSPEQESRNFGLRDESFRFIAERPDGNEDGYIIGSYNIDEDFNYIKRIQDNTVWRVNRNDILGTRFTRRDLQDKRIASGFVEDIVRCSVVLTDSHQFDILFENGYWRFRQTGQPSAIVPTAQAQNFFQAVENLEWYAGLGAITDSKLDVKFDFFDESDELVHYLHIYNSEIFDQRPVMTPEGPYLVEEEQLTMMLAPFGLLQEYSKVPQAPN